MVADDCKAYKTTEKRRESSRKYAATEKGKGVAARSNLKYRRSEKGKKKRCEIACRFQKTEKGKANRIRYETRVRLEALRAYGGESPACSCECGCRESKFVYLELDHVNNDGAAHRKLLMGKRYGGIGFLTILKRLGWPKDPPIRVLCVKCNVGRQRNQGQCPELGMLPVSSRRAAVPFQKIESNLLC
jgi:hypothetical protein